MRTLLVCGGATRGEMLAGLRPRLTIESCLPPRTPICEPATVSYGSDCNSTSGTVDLLVKATSSELPGQHVPFYRRFTEKRRRHRRK
jgi:hypothetical protein